MASTHIDIENTEWTSGTPFYGPAATYAGKDIVQLKILSDRRSEGGGIAWLVKFSPPPGKLIKIVATALSDKHVFNLEGGRVTKAGQPARSPGGYTLNPKGQPHSAFYRDRNGRPRHLPRRAGRDHLDGGAGSRAGAGGGAMIGNPILTFPEAREPQAEAVIQRGLAAYNAPRFRPSDNTTLDILVRDDNSGEILGGLLGHTSYGLFFLDLFYLPEGLRGAGLGSRIIVLAEDEARRCGCTAAFAYTVTFQAPEFYERHGYRRFGEIGCPPDGATRIFLSKTLA
jgi:GNAT superfamily N-acetyltransferase